MTVPPRRALSVRSSWAGKVLSLRLILRESVIFIGGFFTRFSRPPSSGHLTYHTQRHRRPDPNREYVSAAPDGRPAGPLPGIFPGGPSGPQLLS